MQNKPLVVFHKGCLDGIAAAWVFWKKYGNEMEYLPGIYQDDNFDIGQFRDRKVYLADFSYPWDVLVDICSVATVVFLLDHHKSALDSIGELLNLEKCFATTENSGCMIAWQFLFPEESVPVQLRHIEDRDLWRFNLEFTKEITVAMYSYDISTPEAFEAVMEIPLATLVKEGIAFARQHQADLDRFKKSMRRELCVGGYEILAFNVPGKYSSDIGNQVCLEEPSRPFVATYYDMKDGRIFSLRSVGEFDVSRIAKIYGGGGHKNAAGFKVPRNHQLAQNLSYGTWIDVKEQLPEKGQYVILLADRYWSVPEGFNDMKVTATGYLDEFGHLYWSVFGERALELDAFTHWMPIPAAPNNMEKSDDDR